jgi:hypothetical protein
MLPPPPPLPSRCRVPPPTITTAVNTHVPPVPVLPAPRCAVVLSLPPLVYTRMVALLLERPHGGALPGVVPGHLHRTHRPILGRHRGSALGLRSGQRPRGSGGARGGLVDPRACTHTPRPITTPPPPPRFLHGSVARLRPAHFQSCAPAPTCTHIYPPLEWPVSLKSPPPLPQRPPSVLSPLFPRPPASHKHTTPAPVCASV